MPILDAVRKVTRDDIWSRGVQLAREDRVLAVSEDDDEIVLSVVPQGRARPATVHLWPGDSDWSCDCPATLRPCLHIAAAAIALRRAKESGTPLESMASSGLIARVGYRMIRGPRGLQIRRVVAGLEEEVDLEGPLAGKHNGPARMSYVDADHEVEKALGLRFSGTLERERAPRLFRAMSDLSDITLDGEPISVSESPVVPHGWVEDLGDGFRLRLVRIPSKKSFTMALFDAATFCTASGTADSVVSSVAF